MFYYVEFLRAKAAIRIALVILGIVLLVGIILRISVHGTSPDVWSSDLQHSPTARVTHAHLADGSIQTIVDDPQQQTHATITQLPNGKMRMDIREPRRKAESRHDSVSIGSININEDTRSGIVHTTAVYQHGVDLDLGLLFLTTIPMGLIVATFLGGALSKENDGHLELAWTKPVSRDRYALAAIGVDLAAIVIAQLLCLAVTLIGVLLFIVPRFGYGPHVGWNIVVALLAPAAWYALLTAASASVKRGPGMVCGLGWLAAIIVPSVVGALTEASKVNSVAAAFYAVFHTLAYLDPISYLTFHNSDSTIGTGIGLSIMAAAGALAALCVAYIALSVLQWRRVEA